MKIPNTKESYSEQCNPSSITEHLRKLAPAGNEEEEKEQEHLGEYKAHCTRRVLAEPPSGRAKYTLP